MVNFLAELFAKGYQYRSLNAYRSAISSIHQKVDGQSIGQHPLVCRLLKGSYNQKPPTPRYSHFWDVGVVLRFLKQLGKNPSLSLKWISIRQLCFWPLLVPLDQLTYQNLTCVSALTQQKESFFNQHIYRSKAVLLNPSRSFSFHFMWQMRTYVQ